MMQQYMETKSKCSDCILFFRIGDFYEMFFEDAKIASKELELVLTGKDCGMEERAPMCGIPFHAAYNYIPKLIEKGHKVAICEQMEDPALAKGLVKRDIIRIVTPGTILESSMLDEKKNNYIGCLYIEEKLFALAVCDISTGEFITTDYEGNLQRCIDELSKFNPSELLVINNDYVKSNNIKKVLMEKYNSLVSTAQYDSKSDELLIKNFKIDVKHYTQNEIKVCACLYKYLTDTQKNSLSQIRCIYPYNICDYMVMDSATRRNLELTETLRSKSRKGSLLWVLDATQTAMGGRMLRKWIEEPLIDKTSIQNRLDSVDELIKNVYTYSELRDLLRHVYDIERIISKVSCGSANARDMVSLKQSIQCLPDIKSSLSSCKSKLLNDMYKDFDCLSDVYTLIDKSIDDNPSVQLKEGGIIKSEYNLELDELRDAMHNGKQWIADLEEKEKELSGIKSLKVGYNKVFGYYIEVTNSNLSLVPKDRYIRKQTLTNAERFVTPELKEKEEIILGAEDKALNKEYEIFIGIREKVAGEIERIQKAANYIANIDVLLSFAKVSSENNYCKPNITTDGIISIKDGRHPVIEKMIQGIFVPNDTFLNGESDMISIITGPNMAGKSTYMRQVALITLMAHIGCFVPAAKADISIVDRIFTRIGASDDLSLGQSTFMVEMMEVSYILKNATKQSLVLLDEVGRGTSTFDGLSIAWATVEYISNVIKAKTLFATHYHELTEIEGKLKGIKNYCIAVKENGDDIIFLRKIVKGEADKSYGIQVAKLAGLPPAVVSSAQKILNKLEERDINKKEQQPDSKKEVAASKMEDKNEHQISLFDYKSNEIEDYIKNIDILNITPMEAMNYLYDIYKKIKGIRS